MDGSFTYEFDVQTNAGYEVKIDVDAKSGEIEEASFELYEIGMEKSKLLKTYLKIGSINFI